MPKSKLKYGIYKYEISLQLESEIDLSEHFTESEWQEMSEIDKQIKIQELIDDEMNTNAESSYEFARECEAE
ncbi:hypothetical protein [Chamaesiphon polymorphus]|uniref:Uncharacterized protein n=1 Tax=Chamaesiphon polymorphus CCALA 037 TaxID=2107692 RepID=A0A2T1G338_9CYAN|nr:hypothetical protein [Chamaesiphon polymorphus]PSB51580.1 hypothetical protein C7B77_21455 [Chamaesiphon polymorphus CCALA 037]